MNKTEWKFLVDYWSDEKVKVKSEKAKESRGCVRMTHYNGTQSFARLRQEIMETNEGKCSRLDVLVRSRKRKSKKDVNTEALKNNFDAIDEIKKLKEERDQGLTTKTDEQIFQDVLGKDKHGYFRAYGPGKSITQYFKVKPSRLDLTQEAIEVQKKAEQAIEEARKDAGNARAEAEKAKEEAENARAEAEQAKQESLAVRSDVDKKIEASTKVWQDKFNQLLNLVRGPGSLNNNDSGSEGSSN